MSTKKYPIPGTLNVCLAVIIVLASATLLWASGRVESWWALLLLAALYGVVMKSGYALAHEAEHDILHRRQWINDICGTVITLFFPASFQLRRQGHVGHHLRNRTDDEAFDFYFEGESPLWKCVQFYGILTGLFWLTIVFSNFIAVLNPKWLATQLKFDRPTSALQATLNPAYFRLIRLEACLVFALHGAMIYFFKIPFLHYWAVLCGFGVSWSTLQYIHHYGTPRDVYTGALNVRVWRIFDLIWLNHHWHLNHHLSPTVPWIYLHRLHSDVGEPMPFWKAYFRQWRGPRFTYDRITNRHAGKLAR